jgi:DNA-binding MarR family transcriptional regulator
MAERTTDLQRRVLAALAEHGPLDRWSTARHVGTTQAQASRALNTLAARLQVARMARPLGGGAVPWQITDVGRQHLAELEDRRG